MAWRTEGSGFALPWQTEIGECHYDERRVLAIAQRFIAGKRRASGQSPGRDGRAERSETACR